MRGMSSVYSVSSAPNATQVVSQPAAALPSLETRLLTWGMFARQQGLGMLLGAGRISTVTHDHILSLINEEEAPERKENDGEKPHLGTPRLRKDPQPSLTKPKHNVA